jgi:hypothetical protein
MGLCLLTRPEAEPEEALVSAGISEYASIPEAGVEYGEDISVVNDVVVCDYRD